MPPRVYIETSIVSYLVARPSRDALMAHRQQVTRDWWAANWGTAALCTSEIVIREASSGEAVMARERLRRLSQLVMLPLRTEATLLADSLTTQGPLPAAAYTDAMHIALAAVYGIEYLLTWDTRHIANAIMRPAVTRICQAHGLNVPVLCTPSLFPGG